MKHRIFIGSSSEGLEIADSLHTVLQKETEPTVWDEDIFLLSKSNLENLISILGSFDYGIFVFSDDDILKMRNETYTTARDNVVFELGLFMGRLGNSRVFYLTPEHSDNFHLPSDLNGISRGSYNNKRSDGNLVSAVKPFCRKLLKQIKDQRSKGFINLSGEWSERWKVEGSKKLDIVSEDKNVVLIQYENNVFGTHEANNRTYRIEGKIKGNYLDGYWEDINAGGYHGVFQLKINPDNETMQGMWLCFDFDGKERVF